MDFGALSRPRRWAVDTADCHSEYQHNGQKLTAGKRLASIFRMSQIAGPRGSKNVFQVKTETPPLLISPTHKKDECGWVAAALMHRHVCRNIEQPSVADMGKDECMNTGKSWK